MPGSRTVPAIAMPIRLYNSLSKQEEVFTPLDPEGKQVMFYTCGPTVYDYSHIGNFRSFLAADLLRRTLELHGYTVRHVMNMTDVGHMTDDEQADGAGEDKMEEAARRLREQKKSGRLPEGATGIDPSDPYAIADFYANAFLDDARTLGLKVVLDADRDNANFDSYLPRPTRLVPQMIRMIEELIAKQHAYVARDGVVYFDVQSFPEYGRLSGNTLDNLRSGAGGRVSDSNQAVKKHPADFMLWKPDAKHVMKWPSPWGEGYPGWHLECSVMARELLGEEIDLHSGGEDNLFPHHECEIAQSCGATGHPTFARYWFHPRHLMVEGEKMSKSKGNFYTLHDLLAKGASPAAVRLALMQTHYRSNANFMMRELANAQRQVERWQRLRQTFGASNNGAVHPASWFAGKSSPLAKAVLRFAEALGSDLNVAGAIAALNEAVGDHEAGRAGEFDPSIERAALDTMLETLGVRQLAWQAGSGDAGESDLAATVEAKLAERLAARQAKDWSRADAIRDELLEMGVAIKDGPQGTMWERIVR